MKFEENPLVDQALDSTTHNVVNHPKSEHAKNRGVKFATIQTRLTGVFASPKSKRLVIISGAVLVAFLLIVFNWQALSGTSTTWYKQVSEPDLPTGEIAQPLWVSQVNQLRDQFSEQIQQQRDNLENQANNLGSAAQSAQLAYQKSEKNAVDMVQLASHLSELDEKVNTLSEKFSGNTTNTEQSSELAALNQSFKQLQLTMENLSNRLQEERRAAQTLRNEVINLSRWKSEVEQEKQLAQAEQEQVIESVQTNAIPWKLVAASSQGNLAYLEHTGTGAKLRVVQGTDIPHCGKVTQIDATHQQVMTATCAIRRSVPTHPRS